MIQKLFKFLRKNKKGFTLVEIIAVMAILAILMAGAIPAYTGFMEKARESNDASLDRLLKTSISAYVADGTLTLPTDANPIKITVKNTSGTITATTVLLTITTETGTGTTATVFSTGSLETFSASIVTMVGGSKTKWQSKSYATGMTYSVDLSGNITSAHAS